MRPMIDPTDDSVRQRSDPGAPRWLVVALLVFIGLNVLDAAGTVSATSQYKGIAVPFPASVRIALALAWIIVLVVLTVGLLRRHPLAFRLAGPILTAYVLLALIWQTMFARSDYARGQIGFQALLSLIALLPVWWIVLRRGWLRRDSRF